MRKSKINFTAGGLVNDVKDYSKYNNNVRHFKTILEIFKLLSELPEINGKKILVISDDNKKIFENIINNTEEANVKGENRITVKKIKPLLDELKNYNNRNNDNDNEDDYYNEDNYSFYDIIEILILISYVLVYKLDDYQNIKLFNVLTLKREINFLMNEIIDLIKFNIDDKDFKKSNNSYKLIKNKLNNEYFYDPHMSEYIWTLLKMAGNQFKQTIVGYPRNIVGPFTTTENSIKFFKLKYEEQLAKLEKNYNSKDNSTETKGGSDSVDPSINSSGFKLEIFNNGIEPLLSQMKITEEEKKNLKNNIEALITEFSDDFKNNNEEQKMSLYYDLSTTISTLIENANTKAQAENSDKPKSGGRKYKKHHKYTRKHKKSKRSRRRRTKKH